MPKAKPEPPMLEEAKLKEVPVAGILLLPVSLGILLFLCYRLYRFPGDRENAWIYTGMVIAVRAALLSYILCMAGAIVCNPADEPGYFAVGYDLLQGKCMGPWSYPVGHGVLMMMPWIIFTGAKSFFDIAVGISWFSGFVLGSAALLLAFRLLLALRMPVKTCFLILTAGLFGMTCLVRLNNIFFAPVLALILVELLGFGSVGALSILMNLPLFILGGLKIGKRFFILWILDT